MNALAISLSVLLSAPVIADRDVAYIDGATQLQRLDVYATLQNENRPVLIWVHGGGWQIGDKKTMHAKVDAFVRERDFVLVSANYRLHPAADYREQAKDVAAAIAWTRQHAADYGGDPSRIVVMGHSAAAHLVALATVDPRYLTPHDITATKLAGVVLLDGAGYDIPKQISEVDREQSKAIYLKVFGSDTTIQKDASPIHHVGKTKLPPFLIAHVAHRPDATAQAKVLAEAIQQSGDTATRVPAEGKVHRTINTDVGVPGDKFSDAVIGFIQTAVSR